jgi:CRISPR/Cas system endoribonuclease Cas6 (RAMP superfamily)
MHEKKKDQKKQQFVSPIVQTVGEDGANMLGFTVNFSDGSFYNVMRSCSTSNYEQVMAELTKEREATMLADKG